MTKHAQSIGSNIIRRIRRHGRGWVFTPMAFLDLGSRTAVGLVLMRLAQAGDIRQLARGLYDYPRRDPQLGVLSPSSEMIAKALQGRDAIRLQPSGAYAANLIGLSDQVPMRLVFLTDGPSRRVQVGKLQVVLKRTTPRNMAAAGKISGMVIQALRFLGRHQVDARTASLLRRRLSPADKKQLLKDSRQAPAWIAALARQVAGPDGG